MKRKSVFVKFTKPLAWKAASELKLGNTVTFVSRGQENTVTGFYCFPEEKIALSALLNNAKVAHEVA